MATIPLPKPIAVTPFIVPANEQTYSQIFAETMGNAATPDDGFDQQFAALTGLTDAAASIPDFDAADLAAVSDNAAYFGTSPDGALALALQPASDATDAALSDYATLVPPPPPTGGTVGTGVAPSQCKPGDVVQGLTIGAPDPNPYPALTQYPKIVGATEPVMCVGDSPAQVSSETEYPAFGQQPVNGWTMLYGDAAIFTGYHTDTIGADGVLEYRQYGVIITPAKAGRSRAIFAYNVPATGTFLRGFNVTIVQKG